VNDVVQIHPDYVDATAGCLLVVTEVSDDYLVGYIPAPVNQSPFAWVNAGLWHYPLEVVSHGAYARIGQIVWSLDRPDG
jgi:hypothetical protein